MKTCTRALGGAVALLFAWFAADAGAVSVSSRGTGQVLLFPYYTANGGNQTLLTIVNPTDYAKAIKVRFNEARNGRAVFELNLYLARKDTWTAAVFGTGEQGVAKLATNDASCTTGTPSPDASGRVIAEFSTAGYTGANQDWSTAGTPAGDAQRLASPERTRDGFIEVIEMGRLQSLEGALQLAEEVNPARAGASCTELQAAWAVSAANNWSDDPAQAIDPPSGGLFGNGAVIDVASGAMFTYAATALDDFYTYPVPPGALHTAAGSGRPDLRDARNGADFARARVDVPGGIYQDIFPLARAIDAVSLVLMREVLSNEYVVDPALGAASEWVISLPTRRYYSDVASDSLVQPPFTDAFGDDGSATEELRVEYFDRESRVPGIGCDFICPPGLLPPLPSLDDAVNVVAFTQAPPTQVGSSPIFAARYAANAQAIQTNTVSGQLFASGHAYVLIDDPLTIESDHRLSVPGTNRTFVGLPVIGFAVTRIVNSNALPGLLANYGDAVDHAGRARLVTTAPSTAVAEERP